MEIYAEYDSKGYVNDDWHELIVIVSIKGRLGTMRVVGGSDGRMDVWGNLRRGDWKAATALGYGTKGYWMSTDA